MGTRHELRIKATRRCPKAQGSSGTGYTNLRPWPEGEETIWTDCQILRQSFSSGCDWMASRYRSGKLRNSWYNCIAVFNVLFTTANTSSQSSQVRWNDWSCIAGNKWSENPWSEINTSHNHSDVQRPPGETQGTPQCEYLAAPWQWLMTMFSFHSGPNCCGRSQSDMWHVASKQHWWLLCRHRTLDRRICAYSMGAQKCTPWFHATL